MCWLKRYRLLSHSVVSCALPSTCQICGTPFSLRYWCTAWLMRIRPSLLPQAEPYQLQLLGNRRVRHQCRRRLPGVGSRREPADIGERLRVNQADVQRLAAAHRKAGQGAVIAIGIYGVVRIDVRDDVLEQVILERRQPRLHVHRRAPRPAPAPGAPPGSAGRASARQAAH